MHEDPGGVRGRLLRGILNDLFQVEDATDAYVLAFGAETFQRLVESIGDLTAPREAVRAGGVYQGNAGPDRGKHGDQRGTQAADERR
ncbi:hypothetical protein AVL59_30395 [Streptomyces griseochromogenes]|uniref:Uncharacterized protein n=1 Tax=Streptomyces griseochromogenes TaxID=68214 RepID=A0A1B1B372_9ACTN|nr:hypothetical protein AVL59_30395 [Streptomyces griseochromogenes]